MRSAFMLSHSEAVALRKALWLYSSLCERLSEPQDQAVVEIAERIQQFQTRLECTVERCDKPATRKLLCDSHYFGLLRS